jgi:hypothetical protein
MSDFKPIKILDRDQNGGLAYTPFTANGVKYKFIKPGDPIGAKKWTMYEQMKGGVRGRKNIFRDCHTLQRH